MSANSWETLSHKINWKIDLLRKRWYFLRNRNRLKAGNVSFISNNCLGGILSKDMGFQQTSPFVNSWMPAPCFLEALRDLSELPNARISFVEHSRYTQDAINYPLATWKDREIHFIHSHSRPEAEADFYRRLERFKPERAAVVFSEIGFCNKTVVNQILQWNERPKICITTQAYDRSCLVFPRYRGQTEVDAADAVAGYLYSNYDLIGWLNENF